MVSARELSAAADLGDEDSGVRRSERVQAKKAKEAELKAASLAKELAAAAELEQQVAASATFLTVSRLLPGNAQ